MSSKAKPTHHRLLVDVQYPPHPAPRPAGAVVDDYPVAAVADDLAQGWIEETTDTVTPVVYVDLSALSSQKEA